MLFGRSDSCFRSVAAHNYLNRSACFVLARFDYICSRECVLFELCFYHCKQLVPQSDDRIHYFYLLAVQSDLDYSWSCCSWAFHQLKFIYSRYSEFFNVGSYYFKCDYGVSYHFFEGSTIEPAKPIRIAEKNPWNTTLLCYSCQADEKY